jgi:hypothetical protein
MFVKYFEITVYGVLSVIGTELASQTAAVIIDCHFGPWN